MNTNATNIKELVNTHSPIGLSPVAWFFMEQSHSDLSVCEEGMRVSCDSFEQRVCVGSVGFSRGSHFWQFTILTYDTNADIAFGVAAKGVDTEAILGESNINLIR